MEKTRRARGAGGGGTRRGDGISRRSFLKGSAAVLGGAMLASHAARALDLVRRAEAGTLSPDEAYALSRAENILYTSCLQCNTGCGIKVKLYEGLAVKIDGSPYSPFTLVPSVPMSVPPGEAAGIDAAICPKGQSGIQTVYDPYRITKVLKRAGKRGEGKWTTIPFDRAVDEIVAGGVLFGHVPGEEGRVVPGLKELYALRDPGAAAAMAADAKAIRGAADKGTAVAAFRERHAAHLHLLIDPDHPDLGPRNNQLVYMWGRKKGGRADFASRFFADGFGTVNTHGHTTVCQGSLYFTCKAMSEQYRGGAFDGGKKFYWQGDIENAEYVLFAGANLFDANYGPPNRAARLTRNLVEGKTRITVVDPRFSKLAAKANWYLPVKPGEDAAFFQAIIRWIVDNGKYDARYLACANRAAARAAGEPTWTNAVLLVAIGPDGTPGRFLRASEIGLAPDGKGSGGARPGDLLVAMRDGRPVAVDPNDDVTPVTGDILVDTQISGLRVKSGLRIVADEARARTMEEWARLCGIPVDDIAETARKLTSYGKRAVVDVHRGVSQHTNGFYSVTCAMTINLLLGNFDWKGGMIAAAAYNAVGGGKGQPFDLARMNPGRTTRFGISVIRHDIRYEDSTLFAGYPARRNWWPLSSDVYEEVIPSIGDAYPYAAKALFTYMGAPAYSLPAGHKTIGILCDTAKVPLYFCSDILVGETSAYADYIFPDLSYLERWEMHGSHPNMPAKVQPIRQPVIAPIPETVSVFGEEMPCSYEALLLALAERLGIPGFGKDAFGPGQDLVRPDDYYIRMVANVATDGEPVPDAGDDEVALFLESRRHLPRTVFDPARWERIAGPGWRKVVFLLNRGGRHQDYRDAYHGDWAANRYGRLVNIYQEKTAGTRSAFTGKPNPGYATYVPVCDALGKTPEAAGLSAGYPLRLITQKDVTQTKSRTITNYWLLAIRPENDVLVSPADAERLRLRSGDMVRIVSATNPSGAWDLGNGRRKEMRARVRVTETIRPGVVTFTIGHGHWAGGAADIEIDGTVIKGDPRRATGFNANAAMWTDPHLGNTCLVDPVGGSASFYDTTVNLVKG
ncbi:MAG: molybdopterin-dependent oxidoreductase [Gemmatimonadota bacterium]